MKRFFDILISLTVLIASSPPMFAAACLAWLTPGRSFLCKEERVGRGFKLFYMYRFGFSTGDGGEDDVKEEGGGEDFYSTLVGKFVRLTGSEKLPWFINVLKGEMSIVGPHPESNPSVLARRSDFEEILKVRPGLIDLSLITYQHRHRHSADGDDSGKMLAERVKLAREYLTKASFFFDMKLMFKSLCYTLYPWQMISGVLEWASRNRVATMTILYSAVTCLSGYLAFFLRFEGAVPDVQLHVFFYSLPFLIVLRLAFFAFFGLFQSSWRYAGVRDMVMIAVAATASSLVFTALVRGMLVVSDYPRSVIVMDWLITIMALSGMLAVRRIHDGLRVEMKETRDVVIVGAGDACEVVLREFVKGDQYNYKVIGLVDDDPYKKGIKIRDVPVLGTTEDLDDIITTRDPEEVFIAIATPPIELLRRVVKVCRKHGKPIKALPNLKDIVFAKDFSIMLRTVEAEDLLFRDPVAMDKTSLKPFFEGRSVMITGAGGTIGSELSRQIAEYGPSAIILFERHEGSLYQVEMKLRYTHPEVTIYPVVGDVADRSRVAGIVGEMKPQIIFHAAANKHVPMMETNPSEAIKTNIIGTKVLAEVAGELGVEAMVLISTDKAVAPSSVMGSTKKGAELTVQALNASTGTKLTAVRFGNVLESNGSVVPLFKEQIKRGGPITVTDAHVTRYFMTLTEAVHLVLLSATLGSGGEVFVLDMGRPIKVVELAETLIRLYGFIPGKDIEIVFTGLRPGEKLHEKLFAENEEVVETNHQKVSSAVNGLMDEAGREKVLGLVSSMEGALAASSTEEALQCVRELIFFGESRAGEKGSGERRLNLVVNDPETP